jgi:hypothetical protein
VVEGVAEPQLNGLVTFTTTVSRLLTEPRPWVTGCLSGTEQGSASTDAIVRSNT